jgi:hypothetical protein
MVPAFQANGITPKALLYTDQERFQFWRNQDLDQRTTDLDELLVSDIDVAYISSRNDQHAPHAIAAANAVKHVLVESPWRSPSVTPVSSSPPLTRPVSSSPVNHHPRPPAAHSMQRRANWSPTIE